MAFQIGNYDPDTQVQIFDQAAANKAALGEKPNSVTFGAGAPQKVPDQRFAGDIFGGNTGFNGEFARVIGDQGDPLIRDRIGQWAQFFAEGPFGPGGSGVQA